jgi:hypothetical protein
MSPDVSKAINWPFDPDKQREMYADDARKAAAAGFVTKDSGERQVFETGMVRDLGNKDLRPDLVYGPMLIRWAELMGRGANKYGERNWEKARTDEELARFRASAFRHFVQWFYGLDTTEDHAAAVFFNIAGAEHVKERKCHAAFHQREATEEDPKVGR